MEEEVKKDDTFHNLRNIGISFIKEEKNEKSKVKEIFDDKDKDKDECKKQYHKDIENYEKDLSTNPQDAFNLKQLALLYKKVGNFDKSIEAIDKLLVMEPENEDYKKDKVSIEKLKEEKKELKKRKKEKNYPEVEALCKKIFEEAPQAYDIQKEYITSLIYSDKFHELALFLKNDVSEENKNIYKDLNFYLGFSLTYECEFEKAKELLNEVKNEEIKDALKKQCDGLLKTLEESESVINEGEKLTKKGEYDEAIEFYEKALENKQNIKAFNSMLLSKKAFCHYLKEDYDKALETANESVKINPNYSYAYIVRGMIKTQMKLEDAKQDFAKAKEIDPLFSNLTKEIKKDKNQDESSGLGPKGAKKPKVERFMKELPCAIKSSDANIERYNRCFNELSTSQFKVYKENKVSIEEMENKENNEVIKDDEISLGLSVFGQGAEGKLGRKIEEKTSIENNAIVAMRTLYTISINEEEDITFKKSFLDKIEKIAKLECSDEEKAKELDKIFQTTGIYIPLKMYIGGLYKFNTEKMSQGEKKEFLREISANVNLEQYLVEVKSAYNHKDSQESNIDSLKKKTSCIGGDMNQNYEDWLKTVNIKNSDFIQYSEFREIFDFLNDDLKKQLSKPIDIIKKKYKKRINYAKVIENLKNNKGEQLFLDDDEDMPEIYSDVIPVEKKEAFLGYVEAEIKNSYKDIIVGLKINSLIENNGTPSYQNPLLKKEIYIKFKSNFRCPLKYEIKVYLMKYPE